MKFALSSRSLSRLEGVNPALQAIVKEAIKITPIDFGVTEGLRTKERQQELFELKATHTLKSKHLTGHAVDLVAYIGPRISWELKLYDEIALAMKDAALKTGVGLRWGACWHIDNICEWNKPMEDALWDYVTLRRSQGRRPFIDAPHFELVM